MLKEQAKWPTPFVVMRREIMPIAKQTTFNFKQWGGARVGAGRKRTMQRSCVSRRRRPVLIARHPVHVTLRLESVLPSLRNRAEFQVIGDALIVASEVHGLRVVEFAVLHDHVHLVCESTDERSLSRGIQGLCVRIARALNRLWHRKGPVFADRYHGRSLKTPLEVHRALRYVLHNAAHHGIPLDGPDPYSSGAWFDGWRHGLGSKYGPESSPLPRAQTWLLRCGWRCHGLIDPMPPPALSARRRLNS